jgi:tRNA-binding protein
MNTINFDQFNMVELRVGTVVDVSEFPEARKPAYKVSVDFGVEIGVKRTSAQITDLYSLEDLVEKQVIGVVNLPPKQIGPFVSEFLLMGFMGDNGVVLAVPEREVANGKKLM